MNNIYSVLLKTWDKVNYYRNHLNEVDFLKKIVDRRKRFYRYKTDFKLNIGPNGQDVVENKVLFLNDIKLTDSVEENCDFIDD